MSFADTIPNIVGAHLMVVERTNWKTLLILHKENLRNERVKFGKGYEEKSASLGLPNGREKREYN